MRYAAMLIGCAFLAGCECEDRKPAIHDNSTLARVCRDGTHIWHQSDGSYRTGFGYRVEDINTVCAN
jgi:hypothetical protein